MVEILLLLFSCLGFTYFCVEAFSHVSGETSVQTSSLTFPLWLGLSGAPGVLVLVLFSPFQ